MLGETGLIGVIKEEVRKKPLLGICLGMQMLFEKGYEFGETDGLGLIPGSVKLMRPAGELPRAAHRLELTGEKCSVQTSRQVRLMVSNVYFVHSYAAECDSKYIAAWCDYGMKGPALGVLLETYTGRSSTRKKSGETGLNILRCFAEL